MNIRIIAAGFSLILLASPALAASCSVTDLEGSWLRDDGASVVISGIAAPDGGSGLFKKSVNPWVKFKTIKFAKGCDFTAQCGMQTSPPGGGFNSGFTHTYAACIIKLDPVAESFTTDSENATGTFTRKKS